MRSEVHISLLHPTADIVCMDQALLPICGSGFVSPSPERVECIVKFVVQTVGEMLAQTNLDQPHRSWRQAERMLGPKKNLIFTTLYIHFDEKRLAVEPCLHDQIEGADGHQFVSLVGRSRPTRHERGSGIASE